MKEIYHFRAYISLRWEYQGFASEKCLVARCSCPNCKHDVEHPVTEACCRMECKCCTTDDMMAA